MNATLACRRYLQRHSEHDLIDCPLPPGWWQNVLVIPAYRESSELLTGLVRLPAGAGRVIVILVLNRPDSDPDTAANSPLREACSELPVGSRAAEPLALRKLNEHTDLYVHDVDILRGAIPASQGVGLARKIGCDLAFHWILQGVIASPWICSGDADALFPQDYFLQLDDVPAKTVAAVYPFLHTAGPDDRCNTATALYELRLHHYLLGLEYAASPYAMQTLGSCLAVKAEHYAQVRGFPKRAGGEDFYLLNKLAKLGPIEKLLGACISLQSRHSQRAPFGTGPAVAAISADDNPLQLPLFYHPACFEALRCFLAAIPALQQAREQTLHWEQLHALGLAADLAQTCCAIAGALGLEQAIAHCRRQGKSAEQFLRQFHQWFDAFRTLKFIHGIRDKGWPTQSLAGLQPLRPQLWPPGDYAADPEALRAAIMRHRGWLP
jgi:hypothetical protein